MLRERRRGRPRRPLGPPTALVTARLRRLVDDVHEGNLLEASVHAGVPYATLRGIHSGRTLDPRHPTLERITRAYGLPADWFTEPNDGTVPPAGWVGYLPSGPDSEPEGHYARRVAIPFSAWSLIRLLARLEQRLRDLPAHPDRPILGSATDPRECRRRLTAFILQPLLAARQANAGGGVSAGSLVLGHSDIRVRGAGREPWIDALRDLGQFWERALGDLLGDDGPGERAAPASH